MRKKIRIGEIILGEDEKAALHTVIESGYITEGKFSHKFEIGFADYIGAKAGVITNSGTSSLLLGIKALQIDERFPKIAAGKKVITSPVTYAATSNSIVLSGMEPVYADIDPATFKLIPESVEKAVLEHGSQNIGLILPVHLMGYPNDMDALQLIADKYDLQIFEDSAQAHGAQYKGKSIGTFGICSAYSFYVAHNIQAGEMGAVLTSDPVLERNMRSLKANGRCCACRRCVRNETGCVMMKPGDDEFHDPRFIHDHIGYNFKTTDFCAALACTMLEKAEEIRMQRYRNVVKMNELLKNFSDIIQLPVLSEDFSYLGYPVLIRKESGIRRANLLKLLDEAGVENRPLFGCIPLHQPSFSYLRKQYMGRLPNAEYVGTHGFYIGCHQFLSDDDLLFMAEAFQKVIKGLKK